MNVRPRLRPAPFVLALALALAACSSSDPAKAPAPRTDAEYQADVTAGMKRSLGDEIEVVIAAVKELQAAAPTPKGRGWDAKADAEAIAAMKAAWRRSRVAYEHIEGAIAPLFPDIDHVIDERYDGFLSELGGKGDPDPFDDDGVTGLHAAERVIWSDSIPSFVTKFEASLPGYRAAAFPATEEEALRFKQRLLGKIVEDATRLAKLWATVTLDLGAAFSGLIDLMKEQREKVNKASTGQEESRYSQLTLADLRGNRDGTRTIYLLFQPWIRSRISASDPSKDGPTHDGKIEGKFQELRAAYDAIGGDAIPQPPATWSSITPSQADLATPFGQLFSTVRGAVDPDKEGSTVSEMVLVSKLLGFDSVKPGQ